VPRKRPRTAASLLILECDPAKLPAQPRSFATDLESAVKVFAPSAPTVRVQGETVSGLLADLGRLKAEIGRFEIVAIVAHSNTRGVNLTADSATSWRVLAEWLAPFSPRTLILIACEAGRWVAAKPLFEGMPTLKELYASPVLVNDQQAACIKLLIPYLLVGRKLKDQDRRAAQLVNLRVTDGMMLRWTRRDFRKPGVLNGAAWTLGEELLRAALQRVGHG
jgi:hypothetical protein